MTTPPSRCGWAGHDPLMCAYHDTDWGVPERDGRALWEKLMLDGFQAGLAWITVLRKREAFRAAFAGFDPEQVARFDEADIARLMGNAGIIRSRAKIESTIGGARAVQDHCRRHRRPGRDWDCHDRRHPVHDQPRRGQHAGQAGLLLWRARCAVLRVGVFPRPGDARPELRRVGQ